MSGASRLTDAVLERGLVPDALVRAGIRRVCSARLREQAAVDGDLFIRELSQAPIALSTNAANAQHYEVPAAFYQAVLGSQLKYSCGLWDAGTRTLDDAEEAMLRLTVERARLTDGQDILELGCGWGSLTLFMARRFPNARVTAVSNSASQKAFIDEKAQTAGLTNVTVVTADMNAFSAKHAAYDRVVSVEMFEHMRNHPLLLERVSSWMKPDALLFIHIFVHRTYAYPYEAVDASDWMARHFFTGGMMPSQDLLSRFHQHLDVTQQWTVDGTHYEKTSNAWLRNMDRRRDDVMEIFSRTYGIQNAARWWNRWRVFFMACAELFGFDDGEQWRVGHYVLRKNAQPSG